MSPDVSPQPARIPQLAADLSLAGDDGSARNGTKGDQVVSALRAYIAGGEFAPGEKISLRKLAAALDVSVMPVRNAVARLQSDGVLDVEPGRAVRIKRMGIGEFRELTAIRLEVEGFAAQQAARNRTAEDIASMEGFASAFEKLAIDPAEPVASAARVNMQFHFAAYRAAQMPMLIDIIERLWIKAGPAVSFFINSERFPIPTNHGIELHRTALDAIVAGDGEAARAAIVRDIELASERLISADIFDR